MQFKLSSKFNIHNINKLFVSKLKFGSTVVNLFTYEWCVAKYFFRPDKVSFRVKFTWFKSFRVPVFSLAVLYFHFHLFVSRCILYLLVVSYIL